jgi:hypothetical protein
VSRSLHRELLWQARNEGIDLSQLVSELLSSSLSERRRTGGPRRAQGQDDRNGNSRDAGPPRRGGGRNDPRYHNIMEDRGSFMEYVRSLEQSGGRPPNTGGGPRRNNPPHRGGRGPGGGGPNRGGGQGGPPSSGGSGGPGGPGSDDDGGVP